MSVQNHVIPLHVLVNLINSTGFRITMETQLGGGEYIYEDVFRQTELGRERPIHDVVAAGALGGSQTE